MYLWRKQTTNDWLQQHSEALMDRYGSSLAIVERPGKRTVVELVLKTRTEATALERDLGGRIEKLPTDWFRRMVKQPPGKPLRIGSRLVVSRTRGPKTIVVPAEAAFGTGDHATTAMCLRILERLTRAWPPGWSMLDAGTGTGILAMAGSRLGAARVVAIDNDPLACAIAERNARANRVSNIEFRIGNVLKQKPRGKFDIITANLFSEILGAAVPLWLRFVTPNGRLILSGVLGSQERSLVSTLRRNGFAVTEIKRRGKWIALLASRTRKRS